MLGVCSKGGQEYNFRFKTELAEVEKIREKKRNTCSFCILGYPFKLQLLPNISCKGSDYYKVLWLDLARYKILRFVPLYIYQFFVSDCGW